MNFRECKFPLVLPLVDHSQIAAFIVSSGTFIGRLAIVRGNHASNQNPLIFCSYSSHYSRIRRRCSCSGTVPIRCSSAITPQHTGDYSPVAGPVPSNGQLLWKYATERRGISSPAVAHGVFTWGALDGNVYALNATTGEKLWNYTTGGAVETLPLSMGSFMWRAMTTFTPSTQPPAPSCGTTRPGALQATLPLSTG